MNLVKDFDRVDTSLEGNTSVQLSFLKDLGAGLHQVEGLGESVSDECHDVSGNESLLVHSLSTVSPVLNLHLSGHVDAFPIKL